MFVGPLFVECVYFLLLNKLLGFVFQLTQRCKHILGLNAVDVGVHLLRNLSIREKTFALFTMVEDTNKRFGCTSFDKPQNLQLKQLCLIIKILHDLVV